VAGEVLLDPHFVARIKKARMHPGISAISITTNMIAHEHLSDEEWRYVLSELRYLQVSIGGTDAGTYKQMYGVDAFGNVMEGMRRIAGIRRAFNLDVVLAIALRTVKASEVLANDRILTELRGLGYECISAIDRFHNWGKRICQENLPCGTSLFPAAGVAGSCIHPMTELAVLSNGVITGCCCVDCEGYLKLGNMTDDSLCDVWSGVRRKELCRSFETGEVPDLCVKCSSYQPGNELLSSGLFSGITRTRYPLTFYENYLGG